MIYILTETLINPTIFTFRVWESIVKNKTKLLIGPFYPNQKVSMVEQGDLAPHTDGSNEKFVSWETDKYGYRNSKFINNPDIVIIGDSFIAGSSLDQSDLLSSYLSKKTGLKVINIAPANINSFFAFVNHLVIEKPKLVIFSFVERNMATLVEPIVESKIRYFSIRTNKIATYLFTQYDKILRGNSIQFLKSKFRNQNLSDQSPQIEKMFFLKSNISQRNNISKQNLLGVIKILENYKLIFSDMGINFLILPIPNKSTVYWKDAGFESKPQNLQQLTHFFDSRNITYVNADSLMTQLLNIGQYPYHTDDTHWNGISTKIIATNIASSLHRYR